MELAQLGSPSFLRGEAAQPGKTSVDGCNQHIAAGLTPMLHFLDEATVKSQILDEAFRIGFDGPAIEVANKIKIFRSRWAYYDIAGHDTGSLNAARIVAKHCASRPGSATEQHSSA
jgi:hypothetical protein